MTTCEIDTDVQLITPPTREPLDLDFVKKQRRLGSVTSQDTLFDLWIAAARQYFEMQTGRQMMTATWDYLLDAFPCQDAIELPRPPLQDVVGVYYTDDDGAEQTFAVSNYTVVKPSGYLSRRGRIVLNAGCSWPTASTRGRSARIRFVAGYGSAMGDVPELERHVLLTLVGHFHRFGEAVQQVNAGSIVELPLGAKSVMSQSMYTALATLVPRR